MQFTPQQLSGGPKFASSVKIGNWAEDRARAELEAKDYELRRAMGKLATASAGEMRATCLQAVPHSYSADGKLRYGDTVMLRVTEEDPKCIMRDNYLSNNIFDKVDAAKHTVAVSAQPSGKPTARSTFVITRASSTEAKAGDDDVLNYGDAFQLASNPSLRVDPKTRYVARPYMLESEASSTVMGSGTGGIQSVQMAPKDNANTLWVVVAADGNRLATDGTPVPANADVAIYHKATNTALASLLAKTTIGDFGRELAVTCQTLRSTGRGSGGAALPGNRWQIVTAADAAAAVDTRDLRKLTPEALFARVRATIASGGAYSFRGMARAFRVMDDRGDGNLDREDFRWGLRDYGVYLSEEEFDMIFEAFDRDSSGLVSLTEFLAAMRGPLNERRAAVVDRAFAKLDKDGSGHVTIDDLKGVYDLKFHPGVQAGKVSEDAALGEFLGNWDVKDADGLVTKEEFRQYYVDVGASMDSDEYFEAMIIKAWQLEE